MRPMQTQMITDMYAKSISEVDKDNNRCNGKTAVEIEIDTRSLGVGDRGIPPPLQPRTFTVEQRLQDLER